MFDDEPMPAGMLGALWPMAAEVGWERKWGIVTWVGSFPEGTWVDGAELGTMIGMSAARARVQLVELTRAKVLERDGGAGGRKFWYRVNPRWREWRVRWRRDVREVDQRLAWWERRANQHPLEVISARPNGARYEKISARLTSRAASDWARANDPLARAIGARANPPDEGVDNPVARAIGARANPADSARLGARANSAAPAGGEVSLPDARDVDRSPPPTSGTGDPPGWREARRAVLARCTAINGRRLFLEGPPARTLRVLLDHHGVEATMEAINQVPAGEHGPPHFVEALADVLEGGSGDAPVGPQPDSPEVLQRRLTTLKQVIANHEAAGRVPDELQDEYEQLVKELDALTIGGP